MIILVLLPFSSMIVLDRDDIYDSLLWCGGMVSVMAVIGLVDNN
jgi:hypothetical protein